MTQPLSALPAASSLLSNSSIGARASTGIEGLDDILNGGFPRGRLYLVQGEPGVGKTTLAFQFLFEGVKNGEAGLYITLSETRDELLQVARSHGWDLDSISILEMDAEDALSPDAQNTLFHPSEVELGETTAKILAQTTRIRPGRVVFDSLSEVRLLAGAGLRFRRHVLALKQHFAGLGATTLFLDGSDPSPEGDLQSLAHGALTLEHIKPEYGAERRRLFVNKMRGTTFRGGYHDFLIEAGGIAVFPRLVASEHFSEFERETVGSGLDFLDDLAGGGLSRGTSTLILGAAGVGKTMLALQYVSAALGRGESAALFTFEEGIDIILERAQNMKMNLRSPFKEGRLLMQQVDPAALSPGEFARRVRDAVENHGVKIVVIDSLNGYLYAMPAERHLILHMHELLTYLGQKGVVTILISAQSGFLGAAMKSPFEISYLADAVLMLRHFEAFGELRQAISMVKKRSGAHERTIREFIIGSEGIEIGPPLAGFRGILTGEPEYLGENHGLISGHSAAADFRAQGEL